VVRRLAWTVAALAVALGAGCLALGTVNGRSPADLIGAHEAIGLVSAVSFPVLGAMIVARQPRNWFGWLLLADGLSLGVYTFCQEYAPLALGMTDRHWPLPGGAAASWFGAWTNLPGIAMGSTLLVLLFPDGHVLSRRWRPLAWAGIAATAVPSALLAALAWPWRGPRLIGPYPDPRMDNLFFLGFAVALLLLVASVVSVVLRFRRASGIQRLQIKWFAYGGLICLPLNFCGALPVVGPSLELSTVPILFAALAIGMFRYRLYDIDRLLNRTAVYAALTAILGGTYALGVLGLGQLFSHGRHPSSPVVALTTLAVAALFQPARRRVQAAVDRRFNRRRYDAAQTIQAFAARLRQQVDLHALTADLLTVVDQTMQPTHVALWLRPSADPAQDR
jgi:hypothetical protein